MTIAPSASQPACERETEPVDTHMQHLLAALQDRRDKTLDVPRIRQAYQISLSLLSSPGCPDGEARLHQLPHILEALSRLRCNASVLAAALLCDVIELRLLTREALHARFGSEITELAATVAVLNQCKCEAEKAAFATSPNPQERRFDLTYYLGLQRSSGVDSQEAYVVFFEKCLEDLSRLSACSPEERRKKLFVARSYITPAAQKLGMQYHFTLLCEACLAFSEAGEPSPLRDRIYSQRKLLTQVSGEAYSRFDRVMQEILEGQCLFSVPSYNPFLSQAHPAFTLRRPLLACELQAQLQQGARFERDQLDLWETVLICQAEASHSILHHFMQLFAKALDTAGFFIQYRRQESDTVVLRLTDAYENNYRVVLLPEAYLTAYYFGSASGAPFHLLHTSLTNDILRPQITVYFYSVETGYRKYEACIPLGATALDFAFLVSPALAHTTKGAWIHAWHGEEDVAPFTGADSKYPMGTVLHDGDVVSFDADYFPQQPEACIRHTTIDWFEDVNTEYGKCCLIRYFKNLYAP